MNELSTRTSLSMQDEVQREHEGIVILKWRIKIRWLLKFYNNIFESKLPLT